MPRQLSSCAKLWPNRIIIIHLRSMCNFCYDFIMSSKSVCGMVRTGVSQHHICMQPIATKTQTTWLTHCGRFSQHAHHCWHRRTTQTNDMRYCSCQNRWKSKYVHTQTCFSISCVFSYVFDFIVGITLHFVYNVCLAGSEDQNIPVGGFQCLLICIAGEITTVWL